jgi:hypothetical protein
MSASDKRLKVYRPNQTFRRKGLVFHGKRQKNELSKMLENHPVNLPRGFPWLMALRPPKTLPASVQPSRRCRLPPPLSQSKRSGNRNLLN